MIESRTLLPGATVRPYRSLFHSIFVIYSTYISQSILRLRASLDLHILPFVIIFSLPRDACRELQLFSLRCKHIHILVSRRLTCKSKTQSFRLDLSLALFSAFEDITGTILHPRCERMKVMHAEPDRS